MTDTHIIMIILLSAGCTLLWRALPFLIIGRKKEIPHIIKYLGKTLPSAIMALLIVYCLKDVYGAFSFLSFYKIIAVFVCILLHIWKKNTMISIVGSTGVYMIMINLC